MLALGLDCIIMKQLIVFLVLVAACAEGWESGLRVKFDVGLRPGTNFFFDVPKNILQAIIQRWSVTERVNTHSHSSLTLYCPADRVLCAFFDNTGRVAGLQIALAQDEFTNSIYDWETQGFTEWVPTTSTGVIKKYWTIQQYFVSDDSLKKDASVRIAERSTSSTLREGAVWVTGFNGQLERISARSSDIANSIFTEQACIPWMGQHYYYNMSSETECTATTMFPWFPLVNSGQLIGTGFIVFGQHPILDGERDWFERPAKEAVEAIVPRGPQCLYDLAESVGILTMHIYYVEKPWTIGCLFQ